MGAFLPSLETWINPAASSSRSILYFVLRCTPRSCTFVSGKVLLLVFHARYSNQTSTSARGVFGSLGRLLHPPQRHPGEPIGGLARARRGRRLDAGGPLAS